VPPLTTFSFLSEFFLFLEKEKTGIYEIDIWDSLFRALERKTRVVEGANPYESLICFGI